jgi:outer membrane protein assembly factor BamB
VQLNVAANVTMGAPVYAGGLLLVVRRDGSLAALRPSNGTVVWATTALDLVGTPAVLGSTGWLATSDGDLVSVDIGTGAIRDSIATADPMSRTPAVGKEIVVAAGSQQLHVLYRVPNGLRAWSATLPAAVTTGPIISDGSIYLGTAANQVLQYSLSSGGPRPQKPTRE